MKLFRRNPKKIVDQPRVLRLAQFPTAIYAIGDLHGCLSLYDQMEEKIVRDSESLEGQKLILCLGDVIDRGPETANLIDRLIGPAPDGFQRLVLRGNHEEMMLRFLDAPSKNLNWLSYGGTETLQSYGISPENEGGFKGDGFLLPPKLQLAIPEAHRKFLNGLPHALTCDTLRFAHAGYELDLPAKQQTCERMIWGPPERSDSYVGENTLVHGHVIVPEVEVSRARINLDLGAYQTGRLAAMRFLRSDSEPKILLVG